MKVNNPLTPKLPIIVNNRSEAISVVKRLFDSGYTWYDRGKDDFDWIGQIDAWGNIPIKLETFGNTKDFYPSSEF